jgi:hypothetical protein
MTLGPAGVPAFVLVDETTLSVMPRMYELATVEWKALIAWCRFHGLDPHTMPCQQVIYRDVASRRIEYDQFVFDDQGKRALASGDPDDSATWLFQTPRRVFAQGETPPLPFPDVILAHLDPPRETA